MYFLSASGRWKRLLNFDFPRLANAASYFIHASIPRCVRFAASCANLVNRHNRVLDRHPDEREEAEEHLE